MTTPSSEEPGGPREPDPPEGPQSPAPGPQSPAPRPQSPGPQSPGPESPAPPPPPPPGQQGWQQPGQQGWQPPGPPPGGYAQPYSGSPPNASGAVPALVLGILGLVICGICAPFAWSQGLKAERQIAAEPGRWGGKGMATAGKILGIIGTVLLGIGVVVFIIVILASAASA